MSGIVKKESEQALTLQLPNEVVVVPKADIDTRTATKVSMMPDGIFEPIDDKVVAEKGFKADDYIKVPWEAGIIQGKRYAIPLDVPQPGAPAGI